MYKLFISILILLITLITSCTATQNAERFNRQAADPYSMPDKIIKALKIKRGQNIIDLGSGGGYYSFRFANLTGEKGTVYAVDVNDAFLEYIEEKALAKGFKNISVVHAKEDSFNLKANTIDLIFLRNVFHHLPEPDKYFKRIRYFLKRNGRIAIIDYTNEGFSKKIFNHATEPDNAIKAMEKAGYKIDKRHTFLHDQLFFIFKIK